MRNPRGLAPRSVNIKELTPHKELKVYQYLTDSLILGFLCYIFYYLIIQTIECFFDTKLEFSFWKSITGKGVPLDFKEIAYVTGLSVLVGFIFTFLINYKVLYRIAHKLKISYKFGDSDVWSFIMNSKETSGWTVVRDIENDLMYEGWIIAFSESEEKDEFFMQDVKVFRNSTAEELYEIPGLYIPRKRENLVIEFPLLSFSEIERPKKEEEE